MEVQVINLVADKVLRRLDNLNSVGLKG